MRTSASQLKAPQKKIVISTYERGTSRYRALEHLRDPPIFSRKVDIFKDPNKLEITVMPSQYASFELFFRETIQKTLQIVRSKRPTAEALSHDLQFFYKDMRKRYSSKLLEGGQTSNRMVGEVALDEPFVSCRPAFPNPKEPSMTPVAQAKSKGQLTTKDHHAQYSQGCLR